MTAITIPAHGGKDPDGQNDTRTKRGFTVMDAYAEMAGSSFEDSLSDILADLMHFASANGEIFEHELRRACQAFAAETGGSHGTADALPLIDPDERGHALLDHAVAVQREISARGVEAFAASHDDATGHEDEIVYRSAPRWAWEVMDETLAMDAQSSAFDPALRESIKASINALILSCERADDQPISRADTEVTDEEDAA